MNTFWTTLIEINLALSVVYLGYRFLLKNLTFFRWTRVYLLSGMLIGLVYPFLKIQQIVHPPSEAVIITLPDLSQMGRASGMDVSSWAVYLVSATFILFFIRFLVRFLSLRKIHKASERARFNGLSFRNTYVPVNPFSFWKWIYIHRDSHSDPEMAQIVAHEQIHTRQRHTLDVLVAELCTILCWYNPLVKLLALGVKENLEFLVDAEVLGSGIDRTSYQHSLVGVSLNGFPHPRHGNQFAFKTLKRRIYMMNKNQSPKSRLMAYMLITPTVLAFAGLLTFSCQKETLDTLEKAKESEGIALQRSITATSDKTRQEPSVVGVELRTKGTVEGIRMEGKDFDDGAKMVIGKPLTLKGALSADEMPLLILDGYPLDNDRINEIPVNSIESISVLKDKASTVIYGEKAKHGVLLITTKKGSSGSRQ